MDNRTEVKQFNKKLLIVFFLMLAVFATLLVTKVQAMMVSSEIQSLKQSDRPNPTYLTYNDLIDYYDILCCQLHTPLPGQGSVMLTGSHSGGSFSYDMGKWQDLPYSVGSKLESHRIYYQGNDFNASSYSHRTYGYYYIVEQHIATPKEAYIIAEMKKELDIADSSESGAEIIIENGAPKVYTGSLVNAISERLSTGEIVYTVNQRYVLDTGSGSYYVRAAKDSDGNVYYVYETGSDGSLVAYSGNFTYTNPKTGIEVACEGIHAENVYYEFNGTITTGDSVAASEGTLYLVNYDMVVDVEGTLYYCYVTSDYNYIQIAWWTTDMGTSHGTVLPSAPNSLSKEAEAFEDYILEITGKGTVSELNYAVQSYDFYEEDGTHSVGSVTAPVIEYEPGFNDDADQNGVINEADEVTPSFDHEKQVYVVGPFSLNYVKESANIPGRQKVDFSVITGATLISNLGELERGVDWDFHWLVDQARDEEYEFPNPNEVFYIDIKPKTDLVEIYDFSFDFKYMNAGAELDIYDGNYNQVTWTVKHSDNFSNCSDPDCTSCPHFRSRDIWIECTSVVPNDSQTLAHALIGARWYNEAHCSKPLGIIPATITIEKRVYDTTGTEIIPVNRTFQFKIYINDEEFQDISIDVRNGYGKATSNKIVWSKDEPAPTYRVEEITRCANNGPWSGTLTANNNVVVDAKNYIEPEKGWLKINKKLLNATPALESETFHFLVSVTGKFSYNNGPIEYHSSSNPLLIPVDIHGAGTWTSQDFKWYGSSPKYKVEEIIPDGATYELVNGLVANGIGYLRNNTTKTATATNTPTPDWTIIEVDKKLVSETAPQPGEVFKFDLTITGKFSYDGDTICDRTLTFTNQLLDSSNGWKWESKKIVWNKGEIPTYTLKEVAMAEGTTFVSISDEIQTSLINNFSSKLNPEKTLVIITNDREKEMIGKLQINKLVETEDLYGKTFNFNVKVTGTFKYNGTQYTGTTMELPVSITVPAKDPASSSIPVGEWISPYNFSWKKGEAAPTYEVTEINLPAGSKFVSISNGITTITSSQTITGTLIGVEGKASDSSAKAGKVVVTCTNTGTAKKQAHIVIIKESTDESIDDYVFFFKVTITGTFKYYNKVEDDSTIGYTQYTNETLVLDGKIDDVEAVCGGEDWVSELIVWDEMDPNPTYTVEEISIPANIEFVSISNRIKTVTSTKIDGTLAEGTENNYITAINKPGPDFVDGSLRIAKKTSEDLKGKPFYFDLKVTGEFDYAGKHYGAESENGNTYILQNIEVEGNGNPWISGVFSWDEGATAPTYEVKEVNLSSDAHFVSISNEKEICTDPAVMAITGSLNLTKPVKIVAINYGDNIPNGSHIEITKEVLNESLKGINFYFNVKVESTSPFRYHDLEDVTKVTQYNPGDVLEFKNVVAVADERDWVSGYIEWDEGASIPRYEISEITGAFPNGVKSVSIRNDTQIIVKELTNASTEDLVIEGNLVGDITHIIAVNDADDDIPLQGKIIIEKKALSPLISGEEFTFTLKIKGKFKYGGVDYREKEIKDIKITADGPTWESEIVEWYEKDGAPIYTVTEDTATFADGTEFVSIRNAYQTNTLPAITGTVEPHFNNWVIAENTLGGHNKGRLQIHKILLDEKGNQIDGVEFTFKVTVTYADGTVQEDTVKVTSGGYWRSDWYVWSKRDAAPTYHIEEIDNSGYSCTIDHPDGTLVAQDTENGVSGIVTVNAKNVYEEEHQAQIRVNKELIVNDKLSKDDVTVSFSALVKVTGSFTYKGKAYNNETLTLKVTLSKDCNWTWLSDVIRWNGDEAPIFTVEEPESEIPSGWHLVSTEISPSDNTLVDGGTAVADITNEWRYEEELLLTMKIGGKVWDDTNRTTDKFVDSLENGVIDEGEPGIKNVKVTVYRALVDKSSGSVIKRLDGVFAYDANNVTVRIENVTYTDNNGNWSFEAIAVPYFTEEEKELYGENYCVTYDVDFEYDGQTYEPTEFLATAGGNTHSYVGADASNNMYSDVSDRWATIIGSSTSERDKYLYDSMAIDKLSDRTSFNNSFADIQGKEVMDDDGNTVGTTGSGKELNYTSVDSVSFFNSDNSRKISTLQTLNEDDEIYDDFKINAATSNSNLTFPFYTQDPNYDVTAWHLRGWDKTITDIFRITYKFEAVYNYCLSINLGLVEREAADIAVEKDLTEALVVVNGKALKYKFNTAIDLEDPDYTELLYKQLAVADAQIEYKLGLYKGDYYYRAAVYDGSDAGSALQGFYTTHLGLPFETSEMEIYLKYTINVYNQSETYDVTIGGLADYYDDSFKLVQDTEKRYVQTVNGKEVDNVIEVAQSSTVKYLSTGGTEKSSESVTWTQVSTHTGSDGVKYNKLTTSSLANTKIATGEKASVTVTFKIDKDAVGDSGVLNTIKLGEKHNLAELTKFTSYYSNTSENRWSTPGQISGRVDEDSAPDNVNIENYNEKAYYEDDTDSAPIIKVGIYDEQRAISGLVWDDAQTQDAGYGQVVGNGVYNPDEGDKLVNGLTTEIYESITVPETTDGNEKVYKEYQFAWPTETPIAALGNHTIAELTGFHQATTTDNGGYEFINVPAGNYKVRYVYGDKQILTGKNGSEEVYSGQDYKSTAYQTGFNNDRDNDGYVDNEWHDISNNSLSDLRVNDARDDEARRIFISAKSEMLTFDNTTLLATADDKNADHTELFGNYSSVRDNPVTGDGYYMYAETAKINLGVENIYKIGYTTETINDVEVGLINGKATQNGRDVGTSDFKYNIKNVDCGIEERSQTKITLDKQIKEITLMTSDNKIILDAIYDISYTMKSDGTISATVTLNEEASTGIDHIASLNRRGAYDQGYRYIIAEGTILQGTQIQVKYQLTIFNMSETDRISKSLETLWSTMNTATSDALRQTALEGALNKVSTNLYTESKGRVFNDGTGFVGVGYGTYFGSVYYLGSQGVGVRPDETIVKTEVHQMIDYIDPDVEFTDMNNNSRNQSWASTDINYLLSNHLIDPNIVQILDSDGRVTGDTAATRTLNSGEKYSIISDKLQEYMSDSKNNLVLTIDSGASEDSGSNPGFVKFLEPYMANSNVDRSTGVISLTVGRFYSSELDASDIDNLAEIIKVENTAGRRDARNIAGNANPYELEGGEPIGIYAVAQGKEKDASATEVITLSPPTGLNADESRTMQLIIVILISITLVAVAIVVIKKKVLIKK